jgi:type II secretory pathway pseudopilin PulG
MRTNRHYLQGFTLLEITLGVAIALMMAGLAWPNVRGLFVEQQLRERMRQFEEFVRKAGNLARSTRKEVRLIWDKEGVRMVREEPQPEDSPLQDAVNGALPLNGADADFFPLAKGEGLALRRLAARDAQPAPEWSFWPAGVREPAEIYYSGPGGTWALRFNPLVPDPEELGFQAY